MKAIFIIIGGLTTILLHDLCLISLCGNVADIEKDDEAADSKKKAAAITGVTALLLDMVLLGAFIVLALS